MQTAWIDISRAAFGTDSDDPACEPDTNQPLAEQVVDAAREHGALCARKGRPYTSSAWRTFRRLLKRLHKSDAALERVEAELQSLEDARYTRPGREGEWTRHIVRQVRKALRGEGEGRD
ncbi:MAG: hypothetical protein ACOC5B_04750 [Myxococcota bacterium]